jgi:hypothetical protein
VKYPSRPKIDFADVTANKWVLFGFAPNEKVRIFQYEFASENVPMVTFRMASWIDSQVNDSGQLLITFSDQCFCRYVVIGSISGEMSSLPAKIYNPP